MTRYLSVLVVSLAVAAYPTACLPSDDGVIAAVAHHAAPNPSKGVRRLASRITMEALSGGGASTFEVATTYFRREDRLLATRASMGSSGRVQMSSEIQTLSLCGLIDLVAQSGTTIKTPFALTIPLGKILVPVDATSIHENEGYSQMVSFQTAATSICNPQPGMGFSYAVTTEGWSKSGGLFGRVHDQKLAIEYHCMPEDKTVPANQILPGLRGESLAVHCETPAGSAIPVRVDYIFLIESGLYVEVGRLSAVQKSRTELSSVEYE